MFNKHGNYCDKCYFLYDKTIETIINYRKKQIKIAIIKYKKASIIMHLCGYSVRMVVGSVPDHLHKKYIAANN